MVRIQGRELQTIGYAVRETLETEGPLAALAMAGKALGGRRGVVAHSDRGCQYASHAYRARLEEMGWLSSMTEQLHGYENAKAERLNGTLKGEYRLDQPFKTKAAALPAIETAIWTYNHRRLHEKLGYKPPLAVPGGMDGAGGVRRAGKREMNRRTALLAGSALRAAPSGAPAPRAARRQGTPGTGHTTTEQGAPSQSTSCEINPRKCQLLAGP